MRKNMIFCMIGFALVLVTGGHAFAKTGDISMGVISIPLPSNGVDGKDGCTPDVTVTDKDANGCYTTTIQKKTLQSGSCVNDGNAIVRETCDGEDGANGNEIDLDDVYVPYPASTQEDGAGPNQQGFIKKLVNNEVVAKIEDYCDKDYDATNGARMKCVAQGDATAWPVGGPYYETGDTYYFTITDPADVCASVNVSDWGDTPRVTKSQYFEHSGTQTQGVVGYLDTVNTMCDGTDQENITQDFCSPVQPTVANGGTNVTCVNGYTWQRCINQTVAVSANDSQRYYHGCFPDTTGRAVVSRQTNQYQGPDLTNKIKGYIYTLVTYSNGDTDRIDKHEDECDPVIGETSASDDTLKTGQRCKCGGTTSDAPCNVANGTYLLGVYGTVQDLKDLMENQVQVIIRYDSTTQKLYYCIQDGCLSQPYTNTAYWSPVDINGLAGQDGESCLATKSGENWYVCCSPTWTGNDCNQVTDSTIISMLNGMMCQVNYTHKYLHDNNGGDPIANDVKAGAIGERVIVTNTCNSDAENLDSIYGTDGAPGNDYNPCDGLTAGSVAAQTTILNQTKVYRSREYSNNHYSPARGYYETTVTYCEGSATTYAPADECTPVADASLARSVTGQSCGDNQVLKRCMPQEGTQTPYFICDTTEASGYPKQKYFVPAESGNKFIKEGYTAWVHKYTDGGNEVPGELIDKDECRPVYKLERTASGNTVTATTSSVRKCTVQSYDYPTGLTWTVGATYCLNTTNNASTSCAGYSDSISDEITSTLKYHLPIMDTTNTTTPVAPGWTYTEEKDVNSVSLRGTDRDKDQCELLATRTTSGNTTSTTSVWRCTVGAPVGTSGLTTTYYAGATYCLNYANGTCPSSLTDIGAAIDDAADNDPCNGSTSATAVKKVVSRTYTRTTDSQGVLTSVYKMCNDDDHAETTPDECYEIPTPAGETCTNGVWMQCKRQADEGTASATARGTTYGYCATYPQCVGNENSTTIVKKTERAYTAPTKTGTNSYYDTPGKMVTNKIPCSSSASAIVDSSEDDQCEEIPDTGSICPTNKVLKSCKRKGDESSTLKAESTYNLCATGASVFEAIEGNDPCGGDTTSDAAKKKVKNIEYEYVARNATGNTSKVGYSKKTTTMCNTAGNTTEYIYDTCVSVAAASGCNGTNDKNYKCYNQTQPATASASAREYNTCNPSESAVALSSAVANKLDSDVTFAIKPNSQDSNKDYITITGSNITDKPVVALESLQGASVFDIWKEQFTSANGWTDDKCKLAFGNDHTCSNLNESDFLASITAYGVWREEIIKNATSEDIEGYKEDSASLSQTAYQNSLKPCQQFGIAENPSYDGSQGEGKQYVMTCVE